MVHERNAFEPEQVGQSVLVDRCRTPWAVQFRPDTSTMHVFEIINMSAHRSAG
jgi:hypothetical protein